MSKRKRALAKRSSSFYDWESDDWEGDRSVPKKRTIVSSSEHSEKGWSEGSTVVIKKVEWSDGEIEITRTTTHADGKKYSYTVSKDSGFGWAAGRSYHDEFGTKTSGYSYSSAWSSRFGDNWYSGYSKNDEEFQFSKILASVRRSANIVRNTNDESEKEIEVHWASGDGKNKAKDNKIYISPDVASNKHTAKKNWSKDERVDVLIGDVLSQSAMKRITNPGVESRMIARSTKKIPDKITAAIWWATESLAAEQEVMKDFPGFNGYFASQRAYYTNENTFETIQGLLNKEESAVAACLSLNWQMLHPEKNLALPQATAKAIEEALQEITKTSTSVKREVAALKISDNFCKLWPPPKEKDNNNELLQLRLGLGESPGEIVSNKSNIAESPEEVKNGNSKRGLIFEADEWRGGTLEIKKLDTVSKTDNDYRKNVAKLQPQIRALRNRLKLQNEIAKIAEHGLKNGTLDEGSLYKLGYIHFGHSDNKIFEENIIVNHPKLAVMLLVDESSSMHSGNNIGVAKNLAIILVNGFKTVYGVDVAVVGHTGQGPHHARADSKMYRYDNLMVLHHYFTPENRNECSLERIKAFSQNLDGYAISKCGSYLLNWFPDHENKLLIHISDGEPAAGGYGGSLAMNHVKNTCLKLIKFGVKTVGIGINTDRDTYEHMYGKYNTVVLSDAAISLMPTVANMIVRSVGNMNKL